MTLPTQVTKIAGCLSACLLGIATCARAQSSVATFPLVSSCFEDAERLGDVATTDEVKVRYASVAGGNGSCYAVQVTQNGKTLTGFLVGASLPAIRQFETDVRKHVPLLPKLEAPMAASLVATSKPEAPPPPPGPTSLAGLRAVDMYGRTVDLNAIPAANVVVYFWSASNRKSTQLAEGMESIYTQYGSPRKLEMIGFASALNMEQLQRACQESEVVWPQILDRGQVASRYHVDPAKPYLLLDRSRRVVAAVATPKELETELRRIGLK
jgi:hypothetical protein